MPIGRFWVIGNVSHLGRGDPTTASKFRPGGTGGRLADDDRLVFLSATLALGRPAKAQDHEPREEYRFLHTD
jgi:hypothetical protein